MPYFAGFSWAVGANLELPLSHGIIPEGSTDLNSVMASVVLHCQGTDRDAPIEQTGHHKSLYGTSQRWIFMSSNAFFFFFCT